MASKYLTLFLWLLFATIFLKPVEVASQSNKYGSGVVIDDEKYSETPLATPLTNKSYDNIPYRHNLKKYCPVPGDQLGTGTCVGWAAAYGARTIIEAVSQGWDNEQKKNAVNTNAFSPSFVYRQVLAYEGQDYDCYIGVHISDALNIMKRVGNLKINEYPFDENCSFTPSENQVKGAVNFRIKDFQRLTFVKQDNAKVSKVRHSIANNLPVVIGMQIYDNFKDVQHDNNTWNPDKGEKGQASIHAMLVIGYDDESQTFEIMNSWGSEWGNGGFLNVRYEDFNLFVKEAYQVIYDLPTGEPVNNFAANIDYKELALQAEGADMNCTSEVIGSMRATQNGAVYSMHNIYAPYTGFQVYLTLGSKNMNVYAFSIDDNNQFDLLYPFQPDVMSMYSTEKTNASSVSAFIPYPKSTLALPHEDYCLQLDNSTGTLNCFLFSKEPIDMKLLNEQLALATGTGSLYERLQTIFADRLAERSLITYESARIGFEANLDDNRIVPIIIDMNHFAKKP